MQRAVFVDGSNLVYRAFYGLPASLRAASGQPTNAIYGFALMFRKLFSDPETTLGAVVFDAPGGSFREERFADYKGHREAMPADLARQLPGVFALCEAHGVRLLRESGVEADDVLGTLARQAREAGFDVRIVSTDKDFGQLVGDRVRLVDTMKDVIYDRQGVEEKWGVPPERMIDYLALAGDKADNVPGVAGIGEKSAVELVARFGGLDAIYAAVDAPDHGGLKGRQLASLLAGRELAHLSRELVTIRTDLTLGLGLDDLRVAPTDRPRLAGLYRELQFFSLLAQDERRQVEVGAQGARDHGVLEDPEALVAFLAGASEDRPVAVVPIFDEEPPAVAPLLGLGLAILGEDGAAVARHVPWTPALRPALSAWLSDPSAPRTTFDFKGLYRGLRRAGLGADPASPSGPDAEAEALPARGAADFAAVGFDVRLGSFLLDPTGLIPHRLDQVARHFLQRVPRPAKDVIGSGQKQRRFSQLAPAELVAWSCELAETVAALHPVVRAKVAADPSAGLLDGLDLPLSRVLGDMELAGVLVDQEELQRLGVEFRARLEGYEREVWELAGHPFNIGSPRQLGEVLFEELGLPTGKKTQTGYSTDAEVLEGLVTAHPIIPALLNHRKLAKLINTYTDVLTRSVHPTTGRVHTTFQQTSGATGRLITTDPDLQRTPIHTPEGRRIREAFIAPPGRRLIVADWSQIELRLLAHVTGDPSLCAAFAAGADVHRQTAAQIFGVPREAVTPAQRNVGKTINFATIYGQGAHALGQMIGVPMREAKRYIDAYFQHYQGVRDWLDQTTEQALSDGWVATIKGRRRIIPELRSASRMERQAGIRMACNHPIQGSAADLCKAVMLAVEAELRARGLATRMLLQIHDELVLESPEGEVEVAMALVKRLMETHETLSVPLIAGVGAGPSWADAKS
jgi:DNA polymerase-1